MAAALILDRVVARPRKLRATLAAAEQIGLQLTALSGYGLLSANRVTSTALQAAPW